MDYLYLFACHMLSFTCFWHVYILHLYVYMYLYCIATMWNAFCTWFLSHNHHGCHHWNRVQMTRDVVGAQVIIYFWLLLYQWQLTDMPGHWQQGTTTTTTTTPPTAATSPLCSWGTYRVCGDMAMTTTPMMTRSTPTLMCSQVVWINNQTN